MSQHQTSTEPIQALKDVSNEYEEDFLQPLLKADVQQDLNGLVTLASSICNTPLSLINLFDANLQHTKARVGCDLKVLDKTESFCQYTLKNDGLLVIENTVEDQRFQNIPFLLNEHNIRFYAGMPIQSPEGQPIGSICVLDLKPRKLTKRQKNSLELLANEAEVRFTLIAKRYREQQQTEKERDQAREKLTIRSQAIMASIDGIAILDENFNFSFMNDAHAHTFGYEPAELLNERWEPLYTLKQHQRLKLDIQPQLEAQGNWRGEVQALKKNGTKFPIELSIKKLQPGGVVCIVRDISNQEQTLIELQATQKRLRQSVKEKEVLLAEIHHRVKNNLAIISGLLQLESFQTNDEYLKKTLQNSTMRIKSIAKVHELLYEADNFSNLHFSRFVHEIIQPIQEIYEQPNREINFDLQVDELHLNVNQAIPCSLIINELITNAYKHAFQHTDGGTIRVSIEEIDQNILLTVEDDGDGLPDDFSLQENHSLGFTLINTLIDQLEADLKFKNNNGASFSILFEKEHTKGSNSTYQLLG